MTRRVIIIRPMWQSASLFTSEKSTLNRVKKRVKQRYLWRNSEIVFVMFWGIWTMTLGVLVLSLMFLVVCAGGLLLRLFLGASTTLGVASGARRQCSITWSKRSSFFLTLAMSFLFSVMWASTSTLQSVIVWTWFVRARISRPTVRFAMSGIPSFEDLTKIWLWRARGRCRPNFRD